MIPDLYTYHTKIVKHYKDHKKTCEKSNHGRCQGISINEYNIAFSYLKLHQEWQAYHDASIYSLDTLVREQREELNTIYAILNNILQNTKEIEKRTLSQLRFIIDNIRKLIIGLIKEQEIIQ